MPDSSALHIVRVYFFEKSRFCPELGIGLGAVGDVIKGPNWGV